MPFFEYEYKPVPGPGRQYINGEKGTLENLPKDKTKIENEEFYDCLKLKHAVIPEGVTEIGRNAFYNCVNLETISLPSTLIKIGEGAFACCYGLKSIKIPEGVSVLEESAFENCSHLKSVVLPDSLIHIKRDAFDGCYRINTMVFQNCHVVIDDFSYNRLFWTCYDLNEVYVPNNQKLTSEFKSHFSSRTKFVPYEPQESLSKPQASQTKSQDGRDGK